MNDTTDVLVKNVEAGDLEAVKKALLLGANVNTKNRHQENLLHIACEKGHRELAEFLIEQGADIHSLNTANRSVLNAACLGGNVDIVKKLLELDKKDPERKLKKTLNILYGFYSRNFPVFEYLFNENLVEEQEVKKLHFFRYEDGPELIQLLNLIFSRENYLEPQFILKIFSTCAEYSYKKAIDMLLEKFPSILQEPGDYFEALIEGLGEIYSNKSAPTGLKYLLKKGLAFDAVNSDGQTLLHYAAGFFHYNEVEDTLEVEYLIKRGYPIDLLNRKGQTPLQVALEKGYFYQALELIELGADIHLMDKEGKTVEEYIANFIPPEHDPENKSDQEFIIECKNSLIKAIKKAQAKKSK